MLIPVLLFIVGLLCLIKGGDWFVDGATGIARRFHVPELLIGATVVSIGTTLPEVMVSTTSALTGHGEIAYGNAIGSVICNASLIAAITIAVKPGKVDPKSLRTPVLFFFVAAAFYAGVAYTTGSFTRPVGIILLEQGYQIPGAKQKIALLYGKDADFPAVLSKAAALRDTYNVTVLQQAKKLGKQLGQLEAAGFAGAAFMDKDEVKIFAQQ